MSGAALGGQRLPVHCDRAVAPVVIARTPKMAPAPRPPAPSAMTRTPGSRGPCFFGSGAAWAGGLVGGAWARARDEREESVATSADTAARRSGRIGVHASA